MLVARDDIGKTSGCIKHFLRTYAEMSKAQWDAAIRRARKSGGDATTSGDRDDGAIGFKMRPQKHKRGKRSTRAATQKRARRSGRARRSTGRLSLQEQLARKAEARLEALEATNPGDCIGAGVDDADDEDYEDDDGAGEGATQGRKKGRGGKTQAGTGQKRKGGAVKRANKKKNKKARRRTRQSFARILVEDILAHPARPPLSSAKSLEECAILTEQAAASFRADCVAAGAAGCAGSGAGAGGGAGARGGGVGAGRGARPGTGARFAATASLVRQLRARAMRYEHAAAAPPTVPARHFCPVTGLLGKYKDPASGHYVASRRALNKLREQPPPWTQRTGRYGGGGMFSSLGQEEG